MTNKMLAVQAAIISALGNIATDTYNFDANRVQYGDLVPEDGVGPEIALASLEETGLQRPTSTVRKRLSFVIVGITKGSLAQKNIPTDSCKLAADIEKAILNDVTLGSVVDYTQLDRTSIVYFREASAGKVTMDFFSEYAVTVGDP